MKKKFFITISIIVLLVGIGCILFYIVDSGKKTHRMDLRTVLMMAPKRFPYVDEKENFRTAKKLEWDRLNAIELISDSDTEKRAFMLMKGIHCDRNGEYCKGPEEYFKKLLEGRPEGTMRDCMDLLASMTYDAYDYPKGSEEQKKLVYTAADFLITHISHSSEFMQPCFDVMFNVTSSFSSHDGYMTSYEGAITDVLQFCDFNMADKMLRVAEPYIDKMSPSVYKTQLQNTKTEYYPIVKQRCDAQKQIQNK